MEPRLSSNLGKSPLRKDSSKSDTSKRDMLKTNILKRDMLQRNILKRNIVKEDISKKDRIKFFQYYKYIYTFILIALVIGAGAYLQISYDKNVMEKQKDNIYQMLGAMVEGSDIEEATTSILKGYANSIQIEIGKELLHPYGYTKEYVSSYEREYINKRNRIVIISIGSYILIMVSISIMIYYIYKEKDKDIEELSTLLSKFFEGDYLVNLDTTKKGMRDKLHNQLDSLGHKLYITEKRLKEEKEETKSFITDISHQLKTPIASLNMCFSILKDESIDEYERREFMNILGEQIDNLEGLTLVLVNISRLETGLITIQKNSCNIFNTVLQAVNSVYLKAEEKNIQIELKTDGLDDVEHIMLPHDDRWTKEAFVNVLDNGIKYSPRESLIQIRLTKQINYLRVEIEDEGIGIDREEYHHIFKRFYRGKSDLIKNTEGSGVGLYLTRKILEEQGGSISVKSTKNQKVGSIFVIQLSLV